MPQRIALRHRNYRLPLIAPQYHDDGAIATTEIRSGAGDDGSDRRFSLPFLTMKPVSVV